jgi:anaerobic selenocysteine-containing dehydrogenase
LQLSTSGAWGLNKAALESADLMDKTLGRPARVVNMVELGKVLNTLTDPPTKALFVYNSNPAAVCPNHNDVIRGLQRPDLFTAVHEQFFTDTTDYADIVLPATTFFEQKDLQIAYGHYYLQMSNKAIEPLGECRSNVELFRALAQKMGFEDTCFSQSVDEMIDLALSSQNPWLKGIDREKLEREDHARLNFDHGAAAVREDERAPFLPFARGGFQTPSGKAELFNPVLVKQGLDPVAEFVPPDESRHGGESDTFPLELRRAGQMAPKFTFSNLPQCNAWKGPGVEIHPAMPGRGYPGQRSGESVQWPGRSPACLSQRCHANGSRGGSAGWVKKPPGVAILTP